MSRFLHNGCSISPESLAVVGRELDGLLEHFFGDKRTGGNAEGSGEESSHAQKPLQSWKAPLHVWEKEDVLQIDAELPGVSKDAVSITYENGYLNLQAERKSPDLGEHKSLHNSFRYGLFKQRISIGENYDPDTVQASLADGVLSIRLNKKPQVQPKKIEIL
jgi:HSP20 family protein